MRAEVMRGVRTPAGAHALHASLLALPVDQVGRDLVEKLTRHHFGRTPPLRTHGGTRDEQVPLGARDAHIRQTALLGQLTGVFHGACMRERALFHARQEHNRIFEALGGVQRHQRHLAGILRFIGQLVGVGHKRRRLKEPGERRVRRVLLVFGGNGLQLRQVLHTRLVLRILRLLEFLEQPAAFEHLGHDLRRLLIMLLGELTQFLHHLGKAHERVERARRHAFDLVRVRDAVPERAPDLLGMQGDLRLRARAKAALGHVEDAPHIDVVGRVHDRLQIGERVFHLTPLVELRAADELVRHARLDQSLFERPRLRVRTVHDGDVAVAHAVVRVQAFDLRGDPMCFELRGVRGVCGDLLPRARRGPQALRLAPLVVRNDRVRRVENRLRRTVVLFEHDRLRVGKILFEILNVADVGSAERVDGLVGITHHGDPRRPHAPRADGAHVRVFAGVHACELTDEHILRMVRVLVFVHEDVAEFAVVVLRDVWAGAQQLHRAYDQVVEIHGVRGGEPMLVFRIDDRIQLLRIADAPHTVSALPGFEVGRILGEHLSRARQVVLVIRDPRKDRAGRITLHIEVEIIGDELDEALAVGGVVDGEAGFQADALAVAPQDAHARGMERGDPHAGSDRPDE